MKTFISVGECMAELQAANDGLYRLGFAGDTMNTTWYMRALTRPSNVSVEYLTSIGADQLSQKMLAFLKSSGIGTRFISEISDRTVGLYLITLIGAERNFTYWRNTSAAKLLAQDEKALRAALGKADVIYFSGITLAILSPQHRKIFLSVLRDMKKRKAMIAFDTNTRRRLWPSDGAMKKAMIEAYKVATLALPTFDDDRAVFGDKTPAETIKRIRGYGVREVVVKDGEKPCFVLANDKLISVIPETVTGVVDTTGAGDSFNGGYIAARLSGKDPAQAAKFAHSVAGRVICGRGALLDMAGFNDLALK